MRFAKQDRRGVTYQSRIFLLLLLVAVIPVLIVGMISYRIYLEEATKQSDLSMEAMETQVFNDVEGVLSNVRQYYVDASSNDAITWLIQAPTAPYEEYLDLYSAQRILSGPVYLRGYVSGYAFISIRKDWVLTNNGMYRLSEARNAEQVQEFLDRAEENPSKLYWYNNLETPSPYTDSLHRSNTLDLSGFQLIMKLPGNPERMDQLVLVQLNVDGLKQRLMKSLAGYDICIFNRTGEPFFNTDEGLAAFLDTHSGKMEGMKPQNLSVPGGGGLPYPCAGERRQRYGVCDGLQPEPDAGGRGQNPGVFPGADACAAGGSGRVLDSDKGPLQTGSEFGLLCIRDGGKAGGNGNSR